MLVTCRGPASVVTVTEAGRDCSPVSCLEAGAAPELVLAGPPPPVQDGVRNGLNSTTNKMN